MQLCWWAPPKTSGIYIMIYYIIMQHSVLCTMVVGIFTHAPINKSILDYGRKVRGVLCFLLPFLFFWVSICLRLFRVDNWISPLDLKVGFFNINFHNKFIYDKYYFWSGLFRRDGPFVPRFLSLRPNIVW